MKHLSLILVVVFSMGAKASYLESCKFEAEVRAVTNLYELGENGSTPRAVVLELKKSLNQGSHVESACAHHLDQDLKVIKLDDSEVVNFVKGAYVQLDYFYANSFGPNGVMESTRLTLIK